MYLVTAQAKILIIKINQLNMAEHLQIMILLSTVPESNGLATYMMILAIGFDYLDQISLVMSYLGNEC